MTGYNLLAPFLIASVQNRLYKSLKGYTGSVRPMLGSYLFFSNADFSCLKYCPMCVNEDIAHYGVAYWHRSHCVWVSHQCWKHPYKLVRLKNRSNKFELPPQEEISFESCKEDVRSNHTSCESLIQELLAGKLPYGINITHLCKAYSDVLESMKNKDPDCIQDKIAKSYSASMLKEMNIRLTFNKKGRRRWVSDVLSGRTPLHISEHLLVIKELFENVSNLGQILRGMQDVR